MTPASPCEWAAARHHLVSLGIRRRMVIGRGIAVPECWVAQPGSAPGLSGFSLGESLASRLQNAQTIPPKVPVKTSLNGRAPPNPSQDFSHTHSCHLLIVGSVPGDKKSTKRQQRAPCIVSDRIWFLEPLAKEQGAGLLCGSVSSASSHQGFQKSQTEKAKLLTTAAHGSHLCGVSFFNM